MNKTPEDFKGLPAVDKLLRSQEILILLDTYSKDLVLYAIRLSLDFYRDSIKKGNPTPGLQDIFQKINTTISACSSRSLQNVINTTGIVIHTNMGRASFGKQMLDDSFNVLHGYSNLEFDLLTGTRGNRNSHAAELLKFLTGAEDILIVNNNAAAIMLLLRAFAKRKEVIVSRGELIEIGGSFRIPEIMAASDCKMVEIGTTNKTNLEDYKKAISEKTGAIFKAHKSNYIIKGFTEEVSIDLLSKLGKQHKIPVIYDLGSGLLRSINHTILKNEPSVHRSLEKGIDIVCFSGDKLLGGPQAGIIAGKKEFIDKIKKEPMLRALRVCKTTLALLETACLYYTDEKKLFENNMILKILHRPISEIKDTAELLQKKLSSQNIKSEISSSKGQCGGGTLPEVKIESFSVILLSSGKNKKNTEFAEKMYSGLLLHKNPVLGILEKGKIRFDLLTIFKEDLQTLSASIIDVHNANKNLLK